MKHTIPVTAIIEHKGKFLFCKRNANTKNMPNMWVFPGGKIETGEDAIQALVREVQEETALQVQRDYTDIAFLSSYSFLRAEDNSSSVGLVFLIRSNTNQIKIEKEEFSEYKWINPEEILNFKDETIYGMEVHVRNALIVLKQQSIMNWQFFSVTEYQKNNSEMNKEYFNKINNLPESQKISLDKIEPLPK